MEYTITLYAWLNTSLVPRPDKGLRKKGEARRNGVHCSYDYWQWGNQSTLLFHGVVNDVHYLVYLVDEPMWNQQAVHVDVIDSVHVANISPIFLELGLKISNHHLSGEGGEVNVWPTNVLHSLTCNIIQCMHGSCQNNYTQITAYTLLHRPSLPDSRIIDICRGSGPSFETPLADTTLGILHRAFGLLNHIETS